MINSKPIENQDVIRLIKNGVDPIVIQAQIEEAKKSYSQDFVAFMLDMLDKYHVKRTEIARRTGISQDYLYKVLNGTKQTAEKDYVTAICIAVGMNIPETQHALTINGMAMLDGRDLREHILLTCISEQKGVYRTDEWLKKAGFPLLRVSKDMESYTPSIQYSDGMSYYPVIKKHYKVVDREVFAEHCGNASFDYKYWANIVVEDDDSNRFHVQGFYAPDFTAFSVIDEENFRAFEEFEKQQKEKDAEFAVNELSDYEKMINELAVEYPWHTMEEYDDIEAATDSDFFRFFLEIERLTDDKVKEVLDQICDTANYGIRVNFKITGGNLVSYAEQYDAEVPEEKQYFQVVETDGKIVYTASHESVFMWIEMGDLYSVIFGEREEPRYFIHIENEKDLYDLPIRTRFIFNSLTTQIHTYVNQFSSGFVKKDDLDILHEQIERAAEIATWTNINGDFEASLDHNLTVLDMAKECEERYGTNEISTIIATMQKISILHGKMGNQDSSREWQDKIMEYHDRVLECANDEDENARKAPALFAHTLIDQANRAQVEGNIDHVKKYSAEAISLLEPRCQNVKDACSLFQAYLRYSFWLDEENKSDIAIGYYEKAEKLLRKYHIEKEMYWQVITSFYNNYAWVLWNRFENEEAIIYYGKAIEYAEDIIDEGRSDVDNVRKELQHYAEELYKLYLQTDKKKESERLQNRIKEYGITLIQ